MHCLKAGDRTRAHPPARPIGHGFHLGADFPQLGCSIDCLRCGRSRDRRVRTRVRGSMPGFGLRLTGWWSSWTQSAIHSADFLATSHGGAVALMLAAKYPGRVRNLVLHAPANPFSHLGDPLIRFYLSGLGTWFAHRIAGLPEPMQALALGRMYGDPTQVRDGSLGKYIGSLRVPGTVAYVLSILSTLV